MARPGSNPAETTMNTNQIMWEGGKQSEEASKQFKQSTWQCSYKPPWNPPLKMQKTSTVFLSRYRNTSGSLGE